MSQVISGFPGVGKSYIFNNTDLSCCDSDSSRFSWLNEKAKIRHPDFPTNYINHIKSMIGKVDYVFVSSHVDVRKALLEHGIDYQLVIPERGLKSQYLSRYKERGSPEGFVSLIDRMWDDFLETLPGEKVVMLKENQYLVDYI